MVTYIVSILQPRELLCEMLRTWRVKKSIEGWRNPMLGRTNCFERHTSLLELKSGCSSFTICNETRIHLSHWSRRQAIVTGRPLDPVLHLNHGGDSAQPAALGRTNTRQLALGAIASTCPAHNIRLHHPSHAQESTRPNTGSNHRAAKWARGQHGARV